MSITDVHQSHFRSNIIKLVWKYRVLVSMILDLTYIKTINRYITKHGVNTYIYIYILSIVVLTSYCLSSKNTIVKIWLSTIIKNKLCICIYFNHIYILLKYILLTVLIYVYIYIYFTHSNILLMAYTSTQYSWLSRHACIAHGIHDTRGLELRVLSTPGSHATHI